MKRVDSSTKRAPHYARSLSGNAGFLIMKIDGRRLLWVTIDGHSHEIECESLHHALDVLAQPGLVEKFRKQWAQSSAGDGEDHSLEAFSVVWATILAEAEDACSQWDHHLEAVPDRVKRQLLWAFDSDGTLDASRFLTILKHEHVTLTREQLLQLVSELVRKPMLPFFKPSLN